jgi:4-hydroxybenzoate polyprenyltransferase
MFTVLRKLFWVSRPVSWLNTAFPFAATYLVVTGSVDWFFIIATLFFLIPYNLMMYGVNDVFDYESDILNPRKGGVEGMREQRAFHPTILKVVVLTSVPFLLYLFIVGTLVSNIVLVGLVFFVLAYSLAGLRFKERPGLDSVTSSIHFVGPMIFALSVVGFVPESLPYVIAFFLWGMASHAMGAVQDIIPDRAGGLASIATVVGAGGTMRFAMTLYIVAAYVVSQQAFPYGLLAIPAVLYVINVAPYVFLQDENSSVARGAWKRFMRLNLFTGFCITILLIVTTF